MSSVMNISLLAMGGTGAFFGLFLAYASNKFAVEKDEKLEKLEEILPGANCGACGYAGCSNYAEAVVAGDAPMTLCSVGGAAVAAKIGEVMGAEVDGNAKPMVARVKCQGGKGCTDDFEYRGVEDCWAASALQGGQKSCKFSCLGLGSCIKACPFGALKINENNVAEVNTDLCTACGICIKTCPKAVIDLVPKASTVHVLCKNVEKGKDIRPKCGKGCIACKLCEKACQHDAIKVINNVAVIDYGKCTGCMVCVAKCPAKAIEGAAGEASSKKCEAC